MANIEDNMRDPSFRRAYFRAHDLGNLAVIAPHKVKIYGRYTMDWLVSAAKTGIPLTYTTFWKADDGFENNMLSQWYKKNPIPINGRIYDTAEQYMMSEKALMFGDVESHLKIMSEPDPDKCKKLGRGVKGFDPDRWDTAFREIIFHGNLAKLQSDIEIVDALLSTENAVLVEASPYDDIYGAGMERKDLLAPDGALKVLPENWHKDGSERPAQNHLGFVLMAIRDLFWQLMGYTWYPGDQLRACRAAKLPDSNDLTASFTLTSDAKDDESSISALLRSSEPSPYQNTYTVQTSDGDSDQLTLPGMEIKPENPNEALSLIASAGVAFVDKRNAGGNLWIIGGSELADLVAECRTCGVKFYFKPEGGKATKGKPGWWAK